MLFARTLLRRSTAAAGAGAGAGAGPGATETRVALRAYGACAVRAAPRAAPQVNPPPAAAQCAARKGADRKRELMAPIVYLSQNPQERKRYFGDAKDQEWARRTGKLKRNVRDARDALHELLALERGGRCEALSPQEVHHVLRGSSKFGAIAHKLGVGPGLFNEAMSALMRLPASECDSMHYCRLMRSSTSARQLHRCLALMRERGVRHSAQTVRAAMQACAQCGDWESALYVLDASDTLAAAGGLEEGPTQAEAQAQAQAQAQAGAEDTAVEPPPARRHSDGALLQRGASAGAGAGAGSHRFPGGSRVVEPASLRVVLHALAIRACLVSDEVDQALVVLARLRDVLRDKIERRPERRRQPAVHARLVNQVLTQLGRAGRWQECLELIEDMRDPRDPTLSPPDVFSYSATINACGRGGQPSRGLELLEQMIEDGPCPSEQCFGAAIRSLAAAGRSDDALACYQRMLEPHPPRVPRVPRAPRASRRGSDVDGDDDRHAGGETHAQAHRRPQVGAHTPVAPSIYTTASVIRCLGTDGRPQDALEVLHGARRRYSESQKSGQRRTQASESSSQQHPQPDAGCYLAAMRAFAHCRSHWVKDGGDGANDSPEQPGHASMVLQLLETMLADGIQPQDYHWCCLFDAWGRDDQYAQLMPSRSNTTGVWKMVRESGVRPSTRLYNAAIRAVAGSHHGAVQLARRLKSEQLERLRRSTGRFASSSSGYDDEEEGEERDSDGDSEVQAQAHAQGEGEGEGEGEGAESDAQREWRLRGTTARALLRAMVRDKVTPNLETYNLVLSVGVGRWKATRQVLADMGKRGIEPDRDTFMHVVHGAAQLERGWHAAAHALAEMRRMGLDPPRDAYLVAIAECVSHGQNSSLRQARKLADVSGIPLTGNWAADLGATKRRYRKAADGGSADDGVGATSSANQGPFDGARGHVLLERVRRKLGSDRRHGELGRTASTPASASMSASALESESESLGVPEAESTELEVAVETDPMGCTESDPSPGADVMERTAATGAKSGTRTSTSGGGGGLVSRLAAAVRQRLQKRNIQEEIDTCHVYMLTGMREQQLLSQSTAPLHTPAHASAPTARPDPERDAFFAAPRDAAELGSDPPSFEHQQQQAAAVISKQLEMMCGAVDRTLGSGSAFNGAALSVAVYPRLSFGRGAGGGSADDALEDEAARARTALQDELGFALRIGKSESDAPGPGVHLEGHALPGTVLALYPGVVYPPEALNEETVKRLFGDGGGGCEGCADHGEGQAELADASEDGFGSLMRALSEYHGEGPPVISRFDRTCIDGSTAASMPQHPYALGHLVHHAPRHIAPNVLAYAYNFPSSASCEPSPPPFPEHLRRWIPNEFAQAPSWLTRDAAVLVPTVVLVATRAVENEELFMNFRLHPHLAHPHWYHPVDIEEDKRRWGLVGV